MYVNMCGGVYERGYLLRIGWRWNGTWDRCQVILISELTHLVINSDGDLSSALIRDRRRHHMTGWTIVRVRIRRKWQLYI